MISTLTPIFTVVDDFIKATLNSNVSESIKYHLKTNRYARMSMSEVLTIWIAFQSAQFRNFKSFYRYLERHHKSEFPTLISYQHFIDLQKRCLIPLILFFNFVRGDDTGIKFVDSSALPVCHMKRSKYHKVFRGLAQKGKGTMGFFFGFKLHLIINEKKQPVALSITPGDVDDRVVMQNLTENLSGKIYGDRGYIKQDLFESLFKRGVQLITMLRSNMRPKIMTSEDSVNLKKRNLIENVFHIAKNIMHLSHTRHRSLVGFLVNLLSCVCCLCKPEEKQILLPAA